jgi:hypothetical protein
MRNLKLILLTIVLTSLSSSLLANPLCRLAMYKNRPMCKNASNSNLCSNPLLKNSPACLVKNTVNNLVNNSSNNSVANNQAAAGQPGNLNQACSHPPLLQNHPACKAMKQAMLQSAANNPALMQQHCSNPLLASTPQCTQYKSKQKGDAYAASAMAALGKTNQPQPQAFKMQRAMNRGAGGEGGHMAGRGVRQVKQYEPVTQNMGVRQGQLRINAHAGAQRGQRQVTRATAAAPMHNRAVNQAMLNQIHNNSNVNVQQAAGPQVMPKKPYMIGPKYVHQSKKPIYDKVAPKYYDSLAPTNQLQQVQQVKAINNLGAFNAVSNKLNTLQSATINRAPASVPKQPAYQVQPQQMQYVQGF